MHAWHSLPALNGEANTFLLKSDAYCVTTRVVSIRGKRITVFAVSLNDTKVITGATEDTGRIVLTKDGASIADGINTPKIDNAMSDRGESGSVP